MSLSYTENDSELDGDVREDNLPQFKNPFCIGIIFPTFFFVESKGATVL